MIVRLLVRLMLLVAAFSAATALAADAPAKAEKNTAATKTDASPVSADVKKSIDQFNAKRDAMIADRAVKLDQLKNATAEQKKAILEQMQAQQKDLLEAQKALGRQIRDELRKLQQSQPTGR
jgi:hypothetical protein